MLLRKRQMRRRMRRMQLNHSQINKQSVLNALFFFIHYSAINTMVMLA